MDLITAVRSNYLVLAEAEQPRMKVSAALAIAKIPPSNTKIEERKAITSLNKEKSINVLLAVRRRFTVVLTQSDYHSKFTNLLSDDTTYEILKSDSTSGNKTVVIQLVSTIQETRSH